MQKQTKTKIQTDKQKKKTNPGPIPSLPKIPKKAALFYSFKPLLSCLASEEKFQRRSTLSDGMTTIIPKRIIFCLHNGASLCRKL